MNCSGSPPIRSRRRAGRIYGAALHFNGKLPLEACEGVAAAIHASNQRELSAARRLLAGELAGRLTPLQDILAQTLAPGGSADRFCRRGDFISAASGITRAHATVRDRPAAAPRRHARLQKLAHEPSVLLVGRPNAGKSTLLNVLCGAHCAVVSDEAGTTRDVIWATADVATRHGSHR